MSEKEAAEIAAKEAKERAEKAAAEAKAKAEERDGGKWGVEDLQINARLNITWNVSVSINMNMNVDMNLNINCDGNMNLDIELTRICGSCLLRASVSS